MPPTAQGSVKMKGYRELMRTFAKLSKETQKECTASLRRTAEPVSNAAEQLAVSQIRNIGPRWSDMRVGVTTKMVYVAPRARNRGGSKRPNLAPMLLNDAMIPAVNLHESDIVAGLERTLDELGREEGF